jgi:hypothetical protein
MAEITYRAEREVSKPAPSVATGMSELTIRGQVLQLRTIHDLVLMIVRLRYENGLNDKIRQKIILAGQGYGLLSETEKDSPYRGHQRGSKADIEILCAAS